MKIRKLIGLLALTSSIFLTSCGVGPAVKELNKINDDNSRYWAEFIKKNGINAIDYEDDTVLLYALENNNTDLVKACIKCGADVNLTKKQPPLIVYPALNKDVELVKLFLSKGAIVIGNNLYQDSLNYIVKGFSQYNPFDDDAQKIIDLLFTRVTLDDINSIAKENGDGYFENYSSGSRKAFDAVFDKIIAKGYELTEKDIYNISGFLSSEKAAEVIVANLDKVALYWVFEVIAKFDQYKQDDSNDSKYEIFKSILQSIEINESNYSDIKNEFYRLYWLASSYDEGYNNISNLPEKIKETVSILKGKNFNIQDCIISLNYDLNRKLENVQSYEQNVEYWTEASARNASYTNMLESSREDLRELVNTIKNRQEFEIFRFLSTEGFPIDEKDKEIYEYFINNYVN